MEAAGIFLAGFFEDVCVKGGSILSIEGLLSCLGVGYLASEAR